MAFKVEVVKVAFKYRTRGPKGIRLTCRVEHTEGEERLSVALVVPPNQMPVFDFKLSKLAVPTAVEFLLESQNTRCLCPLTFRGFNKKILEKHAMDEMNERLHIAHLSDSTELNAPGLSTKIRKVKAKIWFEARYLQQQCSSQSDLSMPRSPKSEQKSTCDFFYTVHVHPTVFVIFHSVTSLWPGLSSANITPIALLATTPVVPTRYSLFDTKRGPLATIPILQSVALRCSGESNELLQLHIREGTNPLLSVLVDVAKLIPFEHCNWEYNSKWLNGSSWSNSLPSQGNAEPNMMVSILYLPSSSKSSQFEGLELFIEQPKLDPHHRSKTIMVRCKTRSRKRRYRSGQAGDTSTSDETENIISEEGVKVAVMQRITEDSVISTPAYFFFPSIPQLASDFSLLLDFYATIPHETELWWDSTTTSSVELKLPNRLWKTMLLPENKYGLKYRFSGINIAHSYEDAPLFENVNAILRWKTKDTAFLSESSFAGNEYVPQHVTVSEKDTQAKIGGSSLDEEGELVSHASTERNSLSLDEACSLESQPLEERVLRLPSIPTPYSASPYHQLGKVTQDDIKEALTKMGRDILQLREENKRLKKKNADYEKYVLGFESSIINTAADKASLLVLSKHDLVYEITRLSEQLAEETERAKSYQSKIDILQNTLVKMYDTESNFLELQEAHTAQQRLVMDLQEKIIKYKKCAQTCNHQELVISNLECLLAEQTSDYKAKAVLRALTKENTCLRASAGDCQLDTTGKNRLLYEKEKTIATLREELLKMSLRCQELERTMVRRLDVVSTDAYEGKIFRMKELKRELELANIHKNTMVQEMKNNASKWAQEKTEYELQLAGLMRPRYPNLLLHPPSERRRSRSEEPTAPGDQLNYLSAHGYGSHGTVFHQRSHSSSNVISPHDGQLLYRLKH